MRKTQSLLSSVNSQGIAFAEVCRSGKISCSQTLSAALQARKDIRTKLPLHRHPLSIAIESPYFALWLSL